MLEHGIFDIQNEGDVIVAKLTGSFNEYGARVFVNEMMNTVQEKGMAEFAVLVDGTELIGFTPEGYQVLDEYNQWVNDKNMVAKALVYMTSVIPMINKMLIKSQSEQNVRVLSNTDDAMNWLLEELANCSIGVDNG